MNCDAFSRLACARFCKAPSPEGGIYFEKNDSLQKQKEDILAALTEPPIEIGGFRYAKIKERQGRTELTAVNDYPMSRNCGIPRITLSMEEQGEGCAVTLSLLPMRGVLVICTIMSILLIAMGVGMAASCLMGDIDFWFVPCIPWLILGALHGIIWGSFF